LAPEEFLRRRIEQLLEQPDDQFREAAAYVLEKNAELYRRLA
jgi:antitoxin FitA